MKGNAAFYCSIWMCHFITINPIPLSLLLKWTSFLHVLSWWRLRLCFAKRLYFQNNSHNKEYVFEVWDHLFFCKWSLIETKRLAICNRVTNCAMGMLTIFNFNFRLQFQFVSLFNSQDTFFLNDTPLKTLIPLLKFVTIVYLSLLLNTSSRTISVLLVHF